MKKQFATYKISLKVKKLGFDEPCLGIYLSSFCKPNYFLTFEQGLNWEPKDWRNRNFNDEACTAPLWQQIIDWLRIKKNIWIMIEKGISSTDPFWYVIYNHNDNKIITSSDISNYEDIRKAAILKALSLCQK